MLLYSIYRNQETKNIGVNKIDIPTKIERKKPSLIEDIKENHEKELFGIITIKDINLQNKPIYNITSKKNNIEENITILKESTTPDKENSIIFLAAHSGIGPLAYFKNLHKINLNSLVELKYQEKKYIYKVVNIYEQEKNGFIRITSTSNKKIILTTCSENKGKQLIIECLII